jgi:hydrogenase 3 maturation protease
MRLVNGMRLKGKIVIVGIGNTLRGDDAAGPELIRKLKNSQFLIPNSQLSFIDVGEAPENYLEKIVQQKPNTIILVDAVDFGSSPGRVKLFEPEKLEGGGLSTHNASLKLITKYLKKATKADISLLGIQPKSLRLNNKLSEPVKRGLEKIEECLIKCMNLE